MSKILKSASAVAIVATATMAFVGTDVSLAFDNAKAQTEQVTLAPQDAVTETVIDLQNETVPAVEETPEIRETDITTDENGNVLTVQPLPENYTEYDEEAAAMAEADLSRASSLRQLVSAYSMPASLSPEMQCLAGAVYFESKGESLKGQLAVARVVIARAESHRFPDSYCGVVYQRSQFSFVRGGKMPRIRTKSKAWSNAVKIARIAHDAAWESEVEGALFFHARYVKPRWRLERMAAVDNHIFYR